MEKTARDLFGEAESLVKSSQRVRDLAEVFTPYNTIEDMLDLLPGTMWEIHPQATFLEPSCGNGNFLVVVFFRKAHEIHQAWEAGNLAAGTTPEAFAFHLLSALSSIYGVDISEDNIRGHLDDSHDGAHFRLEMFFSHWLERAGISSKDAERYSTIARWIIASNIVVGNMLDEGPDGKPTNNKAMPFVEYDWDPSSCSVSVRIDTLGNMLEATNNDPNSLWSDYIEPTAFWSGNFLELAKLEKPAWKPRGIHKHEKVKS